MLSNIKPYRQGWNACYRDTKTLQITANPYHDAYTKYWQQGYDDAKIVAGITGKCGQFWGLCLISDPIITKINWFILAMLSVFLIVALVGK